MMTVRVVVDVSPFWSVVSVATRELDALGRWRKVGNDGADTVL
jgi:hypothetical protein